MKRRPLPVGRTVPTLPPSARTTPAKVNGDGDMGGHVNGTGRKSNGHDYPVGTPRAGEPSPYTASRTTMEWIEQMGEDYMRFYRTSDRSGAFKPYFPEMVFQLRLLGASVRSIATACNVAEQTIAEWINHPKRRIPIFAEAMRRGAEMADARVAESMYHRAIGYSHDDAKIVVTRDDGVVSVPITKHYPPDSAAGIFWLTNRAKGQWTNRSTTELTGPNGEALVPPQLVVQPVRTKE